MAPLSDREQRILEEIERSLYEEDPGFAREVRRSWWRSGDLRGVKLGIVLFAAGFATLIGFFFSQRVLVGVVAFAAMVAGIVLFAGSLRAFLAARQRDEGSPRDRLGRKFEQWERRLRDRYKRI